jgi:hypothetical protein
MEKRYLLWLTAALASAYGLGEMDLLEAQAISTNHKKDVEIFLESAAETSFEDFLLNQFCPQVDTDFALSTDTCTIDLLKQYVPNLGISWLTSRHDIDGNPLPDKWRLYGSPNWPGNFVASEP